MVSDLTSVIGNNLVRIRRQKGLSLDKLADLSGVSKAMIGQIERGESNPTVNTLWKIATGLHVPFSELIAENNAAVELIRLSGLQPLTDESDGMMLFPVFAFDQEKRFEIFVVTLPPYCSHASEPHDEGSEEYVMLFEGTLELSVNSDVYQLTPGDAIRYRADTSHTYRNCTDKTIRFQNILYYP